MLDLIFTKHNDIKDTEYSLPQGESNHVEIKLKCCLLQEKKIKKRKEKYNYKRGDYRNIKDFFDGINWETLLGDKNLDVFKFMYSSVQYFVKSIKKNRKKSYQKSVEVSNGQK